MFIFARARLEKRHGEYRRCDAIQQMTMMKIRRTKTENGERGRQLLRLQYWKLCAARRTELPALSRSDHALFQPSPPVAGGMRRRSRTTAPPNEDFNNIMTSSRQPTYPHGVPRAPAADFSESEFRDGKEKKSRFPSRAVGLRVPAAPYASKTNRIKVTRDLNRFDRPVTTCTTAATELNAARRDVLAAHSAS